MSKKNFLKIIRAFCLLQFLGVLLYVYHDGLRHSEMILVVISAVFALTLDGFSQTVLKTVFFNQKRQQLDDELDELMRKMEDDSAADQ